MYLDGLEIAGLGAGMVFLALVVMLVSTLILRSVIDRLYKFRAARAPVAQPTTPTPVEEPPPAFSPATPLEAPPSTSGSTQPAPRDKAARAAAIAVALYLAEEEEAEGRTDR